MRVEALRHVRIASVSAGVSHTLAVVVAGELYAWGEGDFGKLGLDDMNGRTTPQLVTACQKVLDGPMHAMPPVRQACAAEEHSLVLTEAGEVYTMGSRWEPHTIVPTLVEALAALTVVEVAVGDDYSLARTDDGKIFSWGCCTVMGNLGHGNSENQPEPKQIMSDVLV